MGSLPNTETLDKHAVFSRTPSFDSSDLTKRLAQLSVSDLATRPHPMIRQASFGDGPGTVDVYTDEEKMEAIIEQFGAIDTGSDKPGQSGQAEQGGHWPWAKLTDRPNPLLQNRSCTRAREASSARCSASAICT